MITSKADYREYLRADYIANGKPGFNNPVWKFIKKLRRAEYITNCHYGIAWRILGGVYRRHFRLYGRRLGYTIPINVFGKGLSIAHVGTIVINANARIGDYCRIHVCTNIGTQAGFSDKAPTIGNRVYIGPGAKIFGKITIGNNVAIGANAVVNKSFVEDNITIAGVPAKIISSKGSEGMIHYE